MKRKSNRKFLTAAVMAAILLTASVPSYSWDTTWVTTTITGVQTAPNGVVHVVFDDVVCQLTNKKIASLTPGVTIPANSAQGTDIPITEAGIDIMLSTILAAQLSGSSVIVNTAAGSNGCLLGTIRVVR